MITSPKVDELYFDDKNWVSLKLQNVGYSCYIVKAKLGKHTLFFFIGLIKYAKMK